MATVGDGRDKEDAFVLAVIRGDMEVNETKLANAVGALEMWPARDEEIRGVGVGAGLWIAHRRRGSPSRRR